MFREPSHSCLQSGHSRALVESARKLLSEQYGYPSEWFPTRWRCTEKDFGVQIAICTKDRAAILVGILTRAPLSDKAAILKQALEEESSCSLGMVIRGDKISTYRYKSKDSHLIAVRQLEPYKLPRLGSNTVIYKSSDVKLASPTLDQKPLTESVESLFYEIHSHIRDIDGLHADEALDELCKLLYTKLFDEQDTKAGEPFRLQHGNYGNTAELSTCIRQLYSEASKCDKQFVNLGKLAYRRSRGIFDDPIRLSAPALAKVVETLERYDISNSAVDLKGRAFQKVFLPLLRAGMGQYFTPHNVVKFMIESVAPEITQLVLDPFCGSGHFLTTTLDFVRAKQSKEIVDHFACQNLHGIEKSERMVRVAMTDMRLHDNGNANIRCSDALLPFHNYHDLDRDCFDLVVTNPPFGSVLGPNAIESLGKFEIAGNRRKVPLELLGLERSLEFLRPGGQLAIVLPESTFSNSSSKYVREWLLSKAEIRAIVSLPIETFMPFGAHIKTSILFCQKHHGGARDTGPLFCGVIERIGYDGAGRRTNDSDFEELALELRESLK